MHTFIYDGITYSKKSDRGRTVLLWNFRAAREGIEWSALITAGILPLLLASQMFT